MSENRFLLLGERTKHILVVKLYSYTRGFAKDFLVFVVVVVGISLYIVPVKMANVASSSTYKILFLLEVVVDICPSSPTIYIRSKTNNGNKFDRGNGWLSVFLRLDDLFCYYIWESDEWFEFFV